MTAASEFTDYLERRHVPSDQVANMLDEAAGLLDDMTTSDGAVDTAGVHALAKRYRHTARRKVVQAELDRRFGKDRPKRTAPVETAQQRDDDGQFTRASAGRAEAQRRFGPRR